MTLNIAYGATIEAAARRHGLDPRLLAAVAAQETGGPGADSGRNIVGDGGHGRGIFQIDDRSHPFARSAAAMEPAANADYAAALLARLEQRYGDTRQALSAYNAGDPHARGTLTDWGDGRGPLGYADSVLRHYARLGGTAVVEREVSRPPAPRAPGGRDATGAPDVSTALSAVYRLSALAALSGSTWALTSATTLAPPDPQQAPGRHDSHLVGAPNADSDGEET